MTGSPCLTRAGSSRSATPIEVYERPQTRFVAGFIGVSNLIERDGALITVRPEKIVLLDDGAPAPAGNHVEAGVIREVSYAGVLTRYVVDLDSGGELVVARQNTRAPSHLHDGRGHVCGSPGDLIRRHRFRRSHNSSPAQGHKGRAS